MNISEKRIRELLRNEEKLLALERGGVDNWDFYDESLKEWRKENELEELIQETVEAILEDVSEQCEVDYPAGMDAGPNILMEDTKTLEATLHRFLKVYKEL